MNKPLRISRTTVQYLSAHLHQPFRVATGQHDSLANIIFSIQLTGGIKGFGEAAVATHITGETLPQTFKNLQKVSQWLQGSSPNNYLEISARLHQELPHNQCALAAVEIALFDALARYWRMPLWRLWTNRPRKLCTDITLVIAGLDETRQRAQAFYTQGFRAFKIKVGQDMDMDFKRVVAVHGVVGQSQIILDANQGYTASATLKFIKLLAKAGIVPDLIEQPVPKGDWEGLKRVTRSTKICVCADESVSSLSDALRAVKEKAVGAINIKLMKTGIIHAVAISQWAHANGLKLMMGGMMESNLAMTTAAHVAAGLGCFDFIDLDTPFFIKGEVARNCYLTDRGVYDLTKAKAGIGIKPSVCY